MDKLIALDTRLFLWINGKNSPFWDHVMWFISGKEEWLPLYLVIIGFIIYRFRWKSIWVFLAVGLFVTLADQISTNVFKEGIKRLRPSHVEELKSVIHLHTMKNGHIYYGGLYGFVSSHAANSFAMAAFTAKLFSTRWYTIFIYAWALVVSYSRIYLGVHYPGDIIGGAVLGIAIGIGVYYLYHFLTSKYVLNKGRSQKTA